MGPRDIVQKALACQLDVIAITDHNSAQNVAGVMEAARETALTVIPGMEVYSREEAHMICLFETVDHAVHFQDVIYAHLPTGRNDPDWYGNQYVVDGSENIVEECPRLLAMPTDLHVHEIVSFVIDLGGIVYPAHIDRRANSMLHALGFIPNNYPMDALEIALPLQTAMQRYEFLQSSPFSLIRSSDAHMIEQLGSRVTWFYIQKPTLAELKKAMHREDGRRTALAIG